MDKLAPFTMWVAVAANTMLHALNTARFAALQPTGAALAAVGEGALDNVRSGGRQVGVGAHDGGVLAAQLHLQTSKP